MSPSHHIQKTTAAILYGPRDIRVEDRDVWPPSQGQVQVQVVATGLCGSDLHYYSNGRNGDFAVRAPLVLGHEAAGVVTAIGAGVTGFAIGQRVAIEAGINCRSCAFCDKGRYNLCKNMRFASSASRFPHVDGTLQSRMNHPAHVIHPLPDACPFELASLAEPLSVLIHASRRCHFQPNESVLVFGVGAIGLLACALAKHKGASRVVAVDINPSRLQFAKDNGFADDVFCLPSPSSSSSSSLPDPCCSSPVAAPKPHPPHPAPSPSPADEQLKKAHTSAQSVLAAFAAPEGFDVVFECTGAEPAIQMSVFVAATGGKVMLIGMGTRATYLPISNSSVREVDIHGSFRYCNTYPEALALLGDGHLPVVARLVTHRYKLEDTKSAFELLRKGVDEQGNLVLKVMVGSGAAC